MLNNIFAILCLSFGCWIAALVQHHCLLFQIVYWVGAEGTQLCIDFNPSHKAAFKDCPPVLIDHFPEALNSFCLAPNDQPLL